MQTFLYPLESESLLHSFGSAMKTRLIFLFFLLASVFAAQASEPIDVSLVQLIADPARYHDREVRIVGYLHLEFEGNALYLHREDFQNSLYKNGIWIDPTGPLYASAKANNNSYVLVVGKFSAADTGHMGLWSGAIVKIERLVRWNTR